MSRKLGQRTQAILLLGQRFRLLMSPIKNKNYYALQKPPNQSGGERPSAEPNENESVESLPDCAHERLGHKWEQTLLCALNIEPNKQANGDKDSDS